MMSGLVGDCLVNDSRVSRSNSGLSPSVGITMNTLDLLIRLLFLFILIVIFPIYLLSRLPALLIGN